MRPNMEHMILLKEYYRLLLTNNKTLSNSNKYTFFIK